MQTAICYSIKGPAVRLFEAPIGLYGALPPIFIAMSHELDECCWGCWFSQNTNRRAHQFHVTTST